MSIFFIIYYDLDVNLKKFIQNKNWYFRVNSSPQNLLFLNCHNFKNKNQKNYNFYIMEVNYMQDGFPDMHNEIFCVSCVLAVTSKNL